MSERKLFILYSAIAISIALGSAAITAGLMKYNQSFTMPNSVMTSSIDHYAPATECRYPEFRIAGYVASTQQLFIQ